jgi:hypothetical protein
MNKIKKYVEDIAEELESSKCYIEKALEYKASGNATRYARYKEMSTQELAHAMTLHEYAVQDIEQLRSVFPDIPQEMMDEWEHAHVMFVEKAAWIKQMQAM